MASRAMRIPFNRTNRYIESGTNDFDPGHWRLEDQCQYRIRRNEVDARGIAALGAICSGSGGDLLRTLSRAACSNPNYSCGWLGGAPRADVWLRRRPDQDSRGQADAS